VLLFLLLDGVAVGNDSVALRPLQLGKVTPCKSRLRHTSEAMRLAMVRPLSRLRSMWSATSANASLVCFRLHTAE